MAQRKLINLSTERMFRQLIKEMRLASYAPSKIPDEVMQELKSDILLLKEDLNATNNRS